MVNLLKINERWMDFDEKDKVITRTDKIEINVDKIVKISECVNDYSIYLEDGRPPISVDKHDYNKIKKAIKLIKIK